MLRNARGRGAHLTDLGQRRLGLDKGDAEDRVVEQEEVTELAVGPVAAVGPVGPAERHHVGVADEASRLRHQRL